MWQWEWIRTTSSESEWDFSHFDLVKNFGNIASLLPEARLRVMVYTAYFIFQPTVMFDIEHEQTFIIHENNCQPWLCCLDSKQGINTTILLVIGRGNRNHLLIGENLLSGSLTQIVRVTTSPYQLLSQFLVSFIRFQKFSAIFSSSFFTVNSFLNFLAPQPFC